MKEIIIYGSDESLRKEKAEYALNQYMELYPELTNDSILRFSGSDLLEDMAKKICIDNIKVIYIENCISKEMLSVLVAYCLANKIYYIITMQKDIDEDKAFYDRGRHPPALDEWQQT